jgi:hypothetical protein
MYFSTGHSIPLKTNLTFVAIIFVELFIIYIILRKLKKNPNDEILKEQLRMFKFHQYSKDQQKEAFENDKKNLKSNECIVIIDFKENIRIGGGPVEIGSDYFNKSQRTVFGVTIYYKENNQLKQRYMVYISEILNHDSIMAQECILNLMKQDWFKKFKKLNLYSDCGPHFRCAHFAYLILNHLPNQYKLNVIWNFYVEGHGKNSCDSLFSQLSKRLNDFESNNEVKSTQDVINCWKNTNQKHHICTKT